MTSPSASKTVVVSNPQGLHARPAYLLAQAAEQFQSKVELIKDGERVDGKSILSILTLGAGKGSSIDIEATGPDASEALTAMAALIESGFPEGDAEAVHSGADE